MPVSLENILYVHDVLYRVATTYKQAGKYAELIKDRLWACFNPINFKMSSIDDYPLEERNYSMNLALPRQLLEESGTIIKCPNCKAIVTSELVPEDLVADTYEFPQWKCQYCDCIQSDAELRCSRCKQCRENSTYVKSLLLKRYTPLHPEPLLNILEEILISLLPLIPEQGPDFFELLDVFL